MFCVKMLPSPSAVPMSFPSHIMFLYLFLSFLISVSVLIFSLFPVDIFSFSHSECHRKWGHSQLSVGLASTGLKHNCRIVLVSGGPYSSPHSLWRQASSHQMDSHSD